MAALYFSLFTIQPFAEMQTAEVDGFDGVYAVHADGRIVGIHLSEPRTVLRLPEIIEQLGLDADRVWGRLRADADVLTGRRQAMWGTMGNPSPGSPRQDSTAGGA